MRTSCGHAHGPPQRPARPARARRAVECDGALREPGARGVRRRLDRARRGAGAAEDRGDGRAARRPSSRATTAPTSASTARSIPTAAASTAASTATRGPATPTWASRRGSTSRAASSSSRRPDGCWRASWPGRATRSAPIHIGGNTDPYQPQERRLRVTRAVLETLERFGHPFSIITKSGLILRDADIIGPMGARAPGPRRRLGDDARPGAGPRHGAARGDAGEAHRRDPRPRRGRLPGDGDVRAGDPRPQRPRAGGGAGAGGRGRRARGRLRGAAAALGDQGPVPRMAGGRPARPRRPRDEPGAPDARTARTTTCAGASG